MPLEVDSSNRKAIPGWQLFWNLRFRSVIGWEGYSQEKIPQIQLNRTRRWPQRKINSAHLYNKFHDPLATDIYLCIGCWTYFNDLTQWTRLSVDTHNVCVYHVKADKDIHFPIALKALEEHVLDKDCQMYNNCWIYAIIFIILWSHRSHVKYREWIEGPGALPPAWHRRRSRLKKIVAAD